jgi:hypothetical protein
MERANEQQILRDAAPRRAAPRRLDSCYDFSPVAAHSCSLLMHLKPECRLNNTQAKKFRSLLTGNGACPLATPTD